MINSFLDRSEPAKPTLALEYSFGRRSGGPGQGVQKQVVNVWELGSLSNSSTLLSIPIKSHGIDNFAAFIVLNLAYPDRLWGDLEASLKGLKQTIATFTNTDELNRMQNVAKKRIGGEHVDISTLDPFPFPVVIIGGYYDKFQDFGNSVRNQYELNTFHTEQLRFRSSDKEARRALLALNSSRDRRRVDLSLASECIAVQNGCQRVQSLRLREPLEAVSHDVARLQ